MHADAALRQYPNYYISGDTRIALALSPQLELPRAATNAPDMLGDDVVHYVRCRWPARSSAGCNLRFVVAGDAAEPDPGGQTCVAVRNALGPTMRVATDRRPGRRSGDRDMPINAFALRLCALPTSPQDTRRPWRPRAPVPMGSPRGALSPVCILPSSPRRNAPVGFMPCGNPACA